MSQMLSSFTAKTFLQQVRKDDMTLIHHIAYSGNIEALKAISEIKYFKEILDESTNEVSLFRY